MKPAEIRGKSLDEVRAELGQAQQELGTQQEAGSLGRGGQIHDIARLHDKFNDIVQAINSFSTRSAS